jgi:hypothetical protein
VRFVQARYIWPKATEQFGPHLAGSTVTLLEHFRSDHHVQRYDSKNSAVKSVFLLALVSDSTAAFHGVQKDMTARNAMQPLSIGMKQRKLALQLFLVVVSGKQTAINNAGEIRPCVTYHSHVSNLMDKGSASDPSYLLDSLFTSGQLLHTS